MSTLIKIQDKGQVTIPYRHRNQAGLAKGDLVEAAYKGGKIVLTPKVTIDRSKFPTADDDYTPAQRRVIDARLAESKEDLKKGRTYGPFNTADEMIASMQANLKKGAVAKTARRAR
jgi:AbrB family looped-hinge helix DNA binding protein